MEEDILARGEDPSLFPILNSKPDLFPDLLWIWESFMVLSSARQVGMSGPQPMTITDINAFCQFHEMTNRDEREEFLYYMQEMDRSFLAYHASKKPTTPGTQPPTLGKPS
jgi:hypothetical protein